MANTNGAVITLAELNQVLSSLKNQRESIRSTYNSMVKEVLESSSYCFSVSGLDYNSILSSFDSTFKQLDSNFEALIDVLEDGVIRTYSELIQLPKGDFCFTVLSNRLPNSVYGTVTLAKSGKMMLDEIMNNWH